MNNNYFGMEHIYDYVSIKETNMNTILQSIDSITEVIELDSMYNYYMKTNINIDEETIIFIDRISRKIKQLYKLRYKNNKNELAAIMNKEIHPRLFYGGFIDKEIKDIKIEKFGKHRVIVAYVLQNNNLYAILLEYYRHIKDNDILSKTRRDEINLLLDTKLKDEIMEHLGGISFEYVSYR